MSETQSKTELPKDPTDPLGFLIVPIFGVLLVAAVLLWFSQKEEEVVQNYFPVTGTITLNGKPLSGRFHVDFYPVEGSSNPVASSWVGPDGSFDLYSSHLGYYGAAPGEYRVVVNMMEGQESWRINAARAGKVEIDPIDGGTLTPPNPDPPFDIRFTDFRTTPQRAVIGEGENVINFDLPLFQEPESRKKGEGEESIETESDPAVQGVEEPESAPKSPAGVQPPANDLPADKEDPAAAAVPDGDQNP